MNAFEYIAACISLSPDTRFQIHYCTGSPLPCLYVVESVRGDGEYDEIPAYKSYKENEVNMSIWTL